MIGRCHRRSALGARLRRIVSLPLALALLGGGAASGCAKRISLDPPELERVRTKDGLTPLRVFASENVVVVYDEAATGDHSVVRGEIHEGAQRERIKVIVDSDTPGLILSVADYNDAPMLWVTFDPSCSSSDCAYGFAQTEADLYRLALIPEQASYAPGKVYRGRISERRRMKKARIDSLAEANEVYLAKTKKGEIETIELEVKKLVERDVTTQTRRNRGIQSGPD